MYYICELFLNYSKFYRLCALPLDMPSAFESKHNECKFKLKLDSRVRVYIVNKYLRLTNNRHIYMVIATCKLQQANICLINKSITEIQEN